MAYGTLTPYRRGALGRERLGSGSLVFDLHRQMNRLFDDLLDGDSRADGGAVAAVPPMDISQDDKKIEICAELPGVKQEDIDINIEDGVLTLTGEKKSERQDENGYSERRYGRFERRITLPSNIDEDACAADFKDGVLKVTIPRSEEKARGRRIPLGGKAGSDNSAESALIDQKAKEEKTAQPG
ncbi:MAG: Hsp20/alpha crystallin family protein [Sphingomonadales bacterium]|nr:Hsp20/alpha crystallin family protein [Sphingomonadales bacterium]